MRISWNVAVAAGIWAISMSACSQSSSGTQSLADATPKTGAGGATDRSATATATETAAQTPPSVSQEPDGDELKVQFFHGEGDPPGVFVIVNQETEPIDAFKITTYAPPLQPGNVLLPEFSFSKSFARLDIGGSVSVSPEDLIDGKNQRLSDRKTKVGVVHLMGKVGSTPKGIMIRISK